MFDVRNFIELQATVTPLFSMFLSNGQGSTMSVLFEYMYTISSSSSAERTCYITNEAEFQDFLKHWEQLIRPVQVLRGEPILPTLHVSCRKNSNTGSAGATSSAIKKCSRAPPSNNSNTNSQSAPSESDLDNGRYGGARKSTGPLTGEEDGSATISQRGPSNYNNGVSGDLVGAPSTASSQTDWYNSREVARQLLASFHPSISTTAGSANPMTLSVSAQPKSVAELNIDAAVAAAQRTIVYEIEGRRSKPTLRVTVRGGEGSFLVPFDPFCRPDFDEWKALIRNEMISRRVPSTWFTATSGTPFPSAI